MNTVLATDIFDKELLEIRKSRWDQAFTEIAQQEDQDDEEQVESHMSRQYLTSRMENDYTNAPVSYDSKTGELVLEKEDLI